MFFKALSAGILKFLKSFPGSKMGNEEGWGGGGNPFCRVNPGTSQSPSILSPAGGEAGLSKSASHHRDAWVCIEAGKAAHL